MYICDNISDAGGRLLFAGQDTVELAERYGTPLYLIDEDRVRHNCRLYLDAMRKHFREGSGPLYASKAGSFKQIYRIMADEGMGIDVVSSGEILTASEAGFGMAHAYFHSNNKTDEDIRFAMKRGVGCFVVDNREELDRLNAIAGEYGIVQNILLRLTPGIDPHTYAEVNTGKVDSKFGAAIETGQAEELTAYALTRENIGLMGFHCHIGSQIFTEDVFERAAEVMLEFAAHIKEKYGYNLKQLNLGGGYGVRYVAGDPQIDIAGKITDVAGAVHSCCSRYGLDEPAVLMEPGRSIIADAGMTLYSAGAVKRIPGYKNYVSIDGGMTDNPRYALYGSQYTVLSASRIGDKNTMTCSLVGRCCESGDIIQNDIELPEATQRGDIIAVCTTGAYNYSMASNYNRIPRPPIVMLKGGESYIAVRRETLSDLVSLDV